MMATTIISWVTLVRTAVRGYGIDADALLHRAGLRADQLDDPSARVPTSDVIRLWRLAVEETGDPCFGLEVAGLWHPTSFHALGFAWLASETLHEALQRLIRYSRTVSTLAQLELREAGDTCDLVIDRNPGVEKHLEPEPATLDGALGSVVTMCRMSAGEAYHPLAVFIRHPSPAGCEDRFQAFFQAPVSFDAGRYALRFATEDLAKPLPSSNLELAHFNEQIVARYLAQLDRSDVATGVKAYLVDHLPSGEVDKEAVAEHLNLSLRSLQRHLQAQGTSYNELLEQTRREMAELYLSNSRMPISEITFLLGFSEHANFSRAFKRWYGQSPSSYREQAGH